MYRVIVDMGNQNALIALAYIKVNKNPLHVFCQYILYLLMKAPDQELRADLLQNNLSERFGISMPPGIIKNCIRILSKRSEVTVLPRGAGYKIANTEFDINAFEHNMQMLGEHEQALLRSLVEFVDRRYNKKWTLNEARSNLSVFLDEEGYGAQLFLQKELKFGDNQSLPSLFIGRYIDSIQQQPESTECKYLEEIVNGIMILQGIRQTGDYQQYKKQKFTDTVFYFDTKLVLRALGFSWKAQVDSVRDLVRLLRDKYNAKIGVFQQTVIEVSNALYDAGRALEKGKPVYNEELRLYSELNPDQAHLMLDYSESVVELLKRELGVDEPTAINWNDDSVRAYNININAAVEYITNRCSWRRNPIVYDVEIINQINILRKADYTRNYGGKNRLPVFVTSNSKLVYTFRDYITEAKNEESWWNPHALPLISDNMLLYRVWVPFATDFSNLPALTLSRYAYSAQSEGIVFFERFRSMASSLEKEKNIDLISIPEAARKQLEDILINATDGDPDKITEEVVASSFEECIRLQNIQLSKELDGLRKGIEKRSGQVVEILSNSYANKLGPMRILLYLSKYWWLLGFATLFAATSAISDNAVLRGISFLPVLIQIVQFACDKFIDDRGWRYAVYNKALSFVKTRYVKKITAKLIAGGHESDLEAVVNNCLLRTPVFNAKDDKDN